MLERSQIEQVLEATDLVDLIGSQVALKRVGARYSGLCPFHVERSPSFSVSPNKGLFFCFGCHVGGDAIEFVVRTQGLTFSQAVAHLAEQAGISIQEPDPESAAAAAERSAQSVMLGRIIDAMAKCLQTSVAARGARAWLKRRGVSREQAAEWSLGYWHPPVAAAIINQNREMAETLGLLNNLWPGRIMFPVYDARAVPVALSGRKLSDSALGGKYINSPNSDIYDKSKVLYGMHKAVVAAAKAKCLIVVEGQMDVLAAHAAGLTHTVGACGSAISSRHLNWIVRRTNTLVSLTDADQAGLDAADRISVTAAGMPLQILLATLPVGSDPSELHQAGQDELIREVVQQARPAIQVRLDQLAAQIEAAGPATKAQLIAQGTARCSNLVDPLERHVWSTNWAERWGVPLVMPDLRSSGYDHAEDSSVGLDAEAISVMCTVPAAQHRLGAWMLRGTAKQAAELILQGDPKQLGHIGPADQAQYRAQIMIAGAMQQPRTDLSPEAVRNALIMRSAQQQLAEEQDLMATGYLATLVSKATRGDQQALEELVEVMDPDSSIAAWFGDHPKVRV